jgi:glutamate--cysteine ligase catalytic subunit
MEVQMTDFENAAFSVFVVLLSRAILSFNLNFYIPISKVGLFLIKVYLCSTSLFKVDVNMGRAQERDASRSRKFYFRKDVFTGSSPVSSGSSSPVDGAPRPKDKKLRNCFPPPPAPLNGHHKGPVEDEYEEMTMDEIMNGKVRFMILPNSLQADVQLHLG